MQDSKLLSIDVQAFFAFTARVLAQCRNDVSVATYTDDRVREAVHEAAQHSSSDAEVGASFHTMPSMFWNLKPSRGCTHVTRCCEVYPPNITLQVFCSWQQPGTRPRLRWSLR